MAKRHHGSKARSERLIPKPREKRGIPTERVIKTSSIVSVVNARSAARRVASKGNRSTAVVKSYNKEIVRRNYEEMIKNYVR